MIQNPLSVKGYKAPKEVKPRKKPTEKRVNGRRVLTPTRPRKKAGTKKRKAA
jgi:hypothetical protein